MNEKKHFSVLLALTDAVPVLLFAASSYVVAKAASSTLYAVGAVMVILASLLKVVWKFLVAFGKSGPEGSSKLFFPMLGTGLLLMVISIIGMIARGVLTWTIIETTVFRFPTIVFFGFFIVGICLMGIIRMQNSKEDFAQSAALNWEAEGINLFTQAFFLLGCIFAVLRVGV